MRAVALLLASVVVYVLELVYAVQLIRTPSAVGPLGNLVDVLLAVYGPGLGRAWSLIGGQREVSSTNCSAHGTRTPRCPSQGTGLLPPTRWMQRCACNPWGPRVCVFHGPTDDPSPRQQAHAGADRGGSCTGQERHVFVRLC